MTEQKSFKRRVRERMSKTGESYTAARTHVAGKRERIQGATERLVADDDRPSEDRLTEATGKTWEAWFTLLDTWGARERTHGETAKHLVENHRVPGWWAQSITVYYERARGLRVKHQKADGFSVSASKTIAVPASVAYDAFVKARTRKRWLPDATLTLRTSQPDRTARFNWEDGTTRLAVSFEAKDQNKTVVAVAHEKLPDADEAESAKLAWRQRLSDLKSFLEA